MHNLPKVVSQKLLSFYKHLPNCGKIAYKKCIIIYVCYYYVLLLDYIFQYAAVPPKALTSSLNCILQV